MINIYSSKTGKTFDYPFYTSGYRELSSHLHLLPFMCLHDSHPPGSVESVSWRGALQHVLRGGRTHLAGGGGGSPRLPQQLQRLVETEQHAAQPGQRGLCKRAFSALLRQGSGSAHCLFLQPPPNHSAFFPWSHPSCCPVAVPHHGGRVGGPPLC